MPHAVDESLCPVCGRPVTSYTWTRDTLRPGSEVDEVERGYVRVLPALHAEETYQPCGCSRIVTP